MLVVKSHFNYPPEPLWLKIHRRFPPHRCLITGEMPVLVTLTTVQSIYRLPNPHRNRWLYRQVASNRPPMPRFPSINVPKRPKS